MTLHEWLIVGVAVANAFVIPAVISFGKGQRRLLKDEVLATFGESLSKHNQDPAAHGNHEGVVKLETQFSKLIEEIQGLSTAIAVLTERLEQFQPKRRR